MQNLPVVYVALLVRTDVDTPLHEVGQEFQVVLLQSLYVQLLHNVVKNYMAVTMITLVMDHTTSQLPSNLHLGNINIKINLTMTTTNPTTGPMTNRPRPSGNPGVNGKTIPRLPRPPTIHTPVRLDRLLQAHFKNPIHSDPSSKPSSKPLTAFSSDYTSHRHNHHPRRSGSVQSRGSTTTVPPGHVPINLQDGSREEWARHVRAMHHPDRMRAATELSADERPKPSMSMEQEEYDVAMEQLHQVDQRIPGDIAKKAVQLFFSTGFLPDYDLSTCHVRELPQTNMLALVMPLPDISRFQMPPPFGDQQSHTWALCHGTTIHTSQLILMEGKIRPANWSFHSDPQRCHLPTFGAFYIGRQVSNADKTFPSWAEQELLDSMEKKGKGQQEITVGAMYRGSRDHLALKAGGNEKGQLNVAEKGIVTTPEKYTIAHSNHVGLKFIALKWADLKSSKSSTKRTIDLHDTDSEEVNYRPNEERHSDRRRG